MGTWLLRVERALHIEYILYAFWAMFWTLNGLDKFFIPERVMIDGSPALRGWFGTAHREVQIIDYFALLNLPEGLALFTLYSISILEILIGLTFLGVLIFRQTPKVVHRMAFKMSMFVFFFFCTGDILFGDRKELWEHGTFMVLALVTWSQYVERRAVRHEVLSEIGHDASPDEGPEDNTQVFDAEVARKFSEHGKQGSEG